MKMKLVVHILALLVFAGFYGCQSGLQSGGTSEERSNLAYFFNIEKSISASNGEIVGIDGFGTEFILRPSNNTPPAKTTTTVADNGALLIPPGGWITIDIPEQFRDTGYLLEFHILYDQNEIYDNTEAHFQLTDDLDNNIAWGDIEDNNRHVHGTFTLQADLTDFAGTSSVTLYNQWAPTGSPERIDVCIVCTALAGSNLEINNYASVIPIETSNDANIFITDIRPASSRVVDSGLAWMNPWNTSSGEDVNTPDNFWYTSQEEEDIIVNLNDVVSAMTQPVLEFNWGRRDGYTSEIYLYDDSSEIFHVYSEDDSFEDMGQTAIVDITAYKNSQTFRFNISMYSALSPFLKIYDAAANSSAVLLDVSPTGREYVSNSGKFLFYQSEDDYLSGGMNSLNVEYDGPHWLADPTHADPDIPGVPFGSDGTLVFSIPSVVSSFNHPVMEIMHFVPNGNPPVDASPTPGCFGGYAPGCPDYFPIEFYLDDDDGNEIAHVFFDEIVRDAGGMLKNQIPIEEFKDSATMTIIVPGENNDRWSQMAFPPFIKIFDSLN